MSSDFIGVAMAPVNLQVNPGDSAEVVVTIQNVSPVVDNYLIEVQGLDSSWFKLSVPNRSLIPADEGSCTITISPPKVCSAVAGDYPFTVTVTSRLDQTQESIVSGKLEVHPFYSHTLELRPERMTGAKGQYSLIVVNSGNTELDFTLEGHDQENLRWFKFDHRPPRVPPCETANIPIAVEPSRRPFMGRPKPYNFTLTATPYGDTTEPKPIRGVLEVTAVIVIFGWLRSIYDRLTDIFGTISRLIRVPWRVLAPVAVTLLVVVAIVLGVIFWPSGGKVIVGEFLLNPGIDINYEIPPKFLDDDTPVTIEATAKWSGGADSLAIAVVKPDGSLLEELEVKNNDSVKFKLDEKVLALDEGAWVVNVKNTRDIGQADGEVKLSFK